MREVIIDLKFDPDYRRNQHAARAEITQGDETFHTPWIRSNSLWESLNTILEYLAIEQEEYGDEIRRT